MKGKRKILEDLRNKTEIKRSIEEQLRRQRELNARRAEADGRPSVNEYNKYDPLLEALKSGKR